MPAKQRARPDEFKRKLKPRVTPILEDGSRESALLPIDTPGPLESDSSEEVEFVARSGLVEMEEETQCGSVFVSLDPNFGMLCGECGRDLSKYLQQVSLSHTASCDEFGLRCFSSRRRA